MSEVLSSRRGFITGLISLVAAPAIVRAGSLMLVKVMPSEAQLLDYAHRLSNPPILEVLQCLNECERKLIEATGIPVRLSLGESVR